MARGLPPQPTPLRKLFNAVGSIAEVAKIIGTSRQLAHYYAKVGHMPSDRFQAVLAHIGRKGGSVDPDTLRLTWDKPASGGADGEALDA
jgi:hypothetical protein